VHMFLTVIYKLVCSKTMIQFVFRRPNPMLKMKNRLTSESNTLLKIKIWLMSETNISLLSIGPLQNCSQVKSMIFVFQML